MSPDQAQSENYQEMKNQTIHRVEEEKNADEKNDQAEIKAVQAALDDLKQQSNAYPEDFVRSLKAENPELYNAFTEETPFEVEALLTEVDAHLAEWEGKQASMATGSDSENLRQMEDRKMHEFEEDEFMKNKKEAYVTLGMMEPDESSETNVEWSEKQELQAIKFKLDGLTGKKDWVSEEFLAWTKTEHPVLFDGLQRVAHSNLTSKEAMVQDLISTTESVFDSFNNKSSKTPPNTEKTTTKVAPREKVSANEADLKAVINKDENEEKFMVKLVDKADENSTQIQDLVEDPTATPIATSSRYPEKEFRYDAAKGSYYDAEDQRMLVYNGDQVTVKKEVAPATVAAVAPVPPVAPVAPEPVAAPAPELVVEDATAPAPTPEPENEEAVAEDLKRKDVVAELKKENLQIVEQFIAAHPELTLKNTIDTGTNHREFRIGRPDSNLTTSVHFNAWTLATPTEPEDVQFQVGDRVFGKLFYDMNEALEAAAQLIKDQEVRIAAKNEKKEERLADKEEKKDKKEAVAQAKEENKERLAEAKGKAEPKADTAVNMTQDKPAWKIG